MLKVRVIKRRREIEVDVEFELAAGGCVGLFGASGAGKSTVLACIAGFEEPDGGVVEWNGRRFFPPSLPLQSRGVGYLTQEPALFPHLRVEQNVTLGLPTRRARAPEQLEWVATLRQRLKLEGFWQAPVAAISGGQARRVALARMLARKPQLVLLDEPFAGMDRRATRQAIDDLRFWRRTLGFAMIAVDHQPDVLRRLCPEGAIALESGQIVQRGAWENLYAEPATPLLASLLRPL